MFSIELLESEESSEDNGTESKVLTQYYMLIICCHCVLIRSIPCMWSNTARMSLPVIRTFGNWYKTGRYFSRGTHTVQLHDHTYMYYNNQREYMHNGIITPQHCNLALSWACLYSYYIMCALLYDETVSL